MVKKTENVSLNIITESFTKKTYLKQAINIQQKIHHDSKKTKSNTLM